MSHLAVLIVLLAAIAQSSPPAFASLTSTETVAVAATVNTKVNINTADVNELMKLSGVGRSLAALARVRCRGRSGRVDAQRARAPRPAARDRDVADFRPPEPDAHRREVTQR